MSRFPLRVLVLEDHSFQRSFAVNILRQLGCREVFAAADGVEALAILQQVGTVDIALCDLCMEGMDGLEFLQRVGPGALVRSIIICSSLSADLCRAVQRIVSLLGLTLLGDVGKPLLAKSMEALLNKYLNHPGGAPAVACMLEPPSEEEVRYALSEGQLLGYYQPKINLQTGAVQGVEVLTRWHHPVRGTLPPSMFMPMMERHGLMDAFLFEQLKQGLSLQQRAYEQGHGLNLAFNLLAVQLAQGDLAQRIKAILTEYRACGCSLTFELTESGLLKAPATSLESLVRLRMMGCRLSIDDFGAGFSSLQRLCQLPFNEIKLDAEFVRSLEQEPRCRAVICSTLALGKSLEMSVVVEGIETLAQHQQLLALGCTVGQGYLYARPMSETDLLRWLEVSARGTPLSNL